MATVTRPKVRAPRKIRQAKRVDSYTVGEWKHATDVSPVYAHKVVSIHFPDYSHAVIVFDNGDQIRIGRDLDDNAIALMVKKGEAKSIHGAMQNLSRVNSFCNSYNHGFSALNPDRQVAVVCLINDSIKPRRDLLPKRD